MLFENPAHPFIERIGLPETSKQLFDYARKYTEFLIQESKQWENPKIDLNLIFKRFNLTAHSGDLKGQLGIDGFAAEEFGLVFYDDTDPITRQRFTQAHELLEYFVKVLQGNKLTSQVQRYLDGVVKEKLCNWGAGHLLMPSRWLKDDIDERGASIPTAQHLTSVYDVSLLAALYRIVYQLDHRYGLIVWRFAHKPKEIKSLSDAKMPSLFPDEPILEPQKELRVWWPVLGREARRIFYIPQHKSISRESLIFKSYWDEEYQEGIELIDLGKLKGDYWIEALPYWINDELCVITLIDWEEELVSLRKIENEHLFADWF